MKPLPRLLISLTVLSAGLLIAALYMVFFYAPLELVMNYVQKIFYFHISTAWVGMLGFLVAGLTGILFLVTKNQKWDIVELAAVEISLLFFFTAIISGSIWARPTWGTWWTWDARLTTAAILEMIYLAYLLLRKGIEDPDKRSRFSAVYTLVGGVSVPVTFFSIRLWQTIHPAILGGQIQGAEGKFGMTLGMSYTMIICLFTFTIIFITLLWHRVRIGTMAQCVEI